ncbi:MAG: MFS transporter [Elusimicrobia bacterium]|nr:MFS transporter [Elusimicrobiota bacterium]
MNLKENFKKGLSKNIIFLGIVSGLTDISSEMLYPIIPIFLTSVLNAPMSVVGLIEGIAEATASILKIYGGRLSDKFSKRKPFVVAGYSLSAFAKPLMAFAFTWHFVLFARFIDRVGKGIRSSARDALISSSTQKEYWGKAFGFHRAMDTFGAAVGPLFALLLLNILGDNSYKEIFIIAFIPALLGVAVLLYFVKEAGTQPANKAENSVDNISLGKDFYVFTAIYMVFTLGNSSGAFLILKTKDLGFSVSSVIFVYFVYNLISAALSTPAGILADRFGKIKALILGMIIFSAVYLGFAINENKIGIWILFAVFGFYGALSEGIYKAIISHLSPPEKRATAMGYFQGFMGMFLFLSSFLAGIIWDKAGKQYPFYFGSLLSLISAVFLFYWSKRKKFTF